MRFLTLLLAVTWAHAQNVPTPDIRLTSAEMRGQLLTKVAPVYPSAARRAHVEGVVVLHAIIDRFGHVITVNVLSGPEMLQEAALNAVRQWTYRPYMLNGAPAVVDTTISVSFGFGVSRNTLPNAVEGSFVAYRNEPIPVGRVRVDESVMSHLLEQRVEPVYPPTAVAAQVGGPVVLHAIVSTAGEVRDVTVVSGPPLLIASAMSAVRRWRYKPYAVNGMPVEVDTTMSVPFDWLTQPAPSQVRNDGEQPSPATPRVSGGVMAGLLLTKVEPVYPQEVKDAHVGGTVSMRAAINRDGVVTDLTVVSGSIMLRDPALNAVKQWRYRPYLLNGVPAAVETVITVNFSQPELTAWDAGSSSPGLLPGRVRVSSGVMAGQAIRRPMPMFPEEARKLHVSGSVVMHVVIGRDGKVVDVTPVSGPELLRKPYCDAVRQWEFHPFLLNGEAVEVESTITLILDMGAG